MSSRQSSAAAASSARAAAATSNSRVARRAGKEEQGAAPGSSGPRARVHARGAARARGLARTGVELRPATGGRGRRLTATDRRGKRGESGEKLTVMLKASSWWPGTAGMRRIVATVAGNELDPERTVRPGSGSSVETKETTVGRLLDIFLESGEVGGCDDDGSHGEQLSGKLQNREQRMGKKELMARVRSRGSWRG